MRNTTQSPAATRPAGTAAPAQSTGPIVFEKTIDAPVETVWRTFTSAAEVSKWFAPAANVDLRVGGAFELFFWPADRNVNSTLGCRITRLEPRKHLGFNWRGPQEHFATMEQGTPPPPPTHVTVTFAPSGQGTSVRVSHTGWGEGPRWAAARAWHAGPWQFALENLKLRCEGKPTLPPPTTRPSSQAR